MEIVQVILAYIVVNYLELIGAIFGVICVYLNTKENIWGWPTGIVSVGIYTYVFFETSLYGDFMLNGTYVVLGFYGWYNWLYGSAKHSILEISLSDKEEVLLLFAIGILGIFIGGRILTAVDGSLPYWDATTTAFSLIAQWQLTKKRLENWLVWIFVDVLCVGLYLYKGIYIAAGLYTIYLILATLGYFDWRKAFKEQTAILLKGYK